MNDPIKISELEPGETFEIPSVSETMRNGVFLFTTDTSSRVIIDVYEHDSWHTKQREYISNSVKVIVNGKVELTKGAGGIVEIAGTLNESGELIKIRRGRKAKTPETLDTTENTSILSSGEQKAKIKFLKARAALAVKTKVIKVKKPPYVPTGKPRGRKPSTFVAIFPKGKWTIEDAATLNKVEKHTITNFMNKATKDKTMKFECVGEKRKDGQRGKPTKIWKVVK